MKRLSLALCLMAGVGPAGAQDLAAARQSLKNYGLAYCMARQFPERSAMGEDVGHAIGMYGVMGGGLHQVLQDEDTLTTLHDPYDATTDYVFKAYDQVAANSKYRPGKVVLHACLQVYNSRAFDRFIRTQDSYIRQQDLQAASPAS